MALCLRSVGAFTLSISLLASCATSPTLGFADYGGTVRGDEEGFSFVGGVLPETFFKSFHRAVDSRDLRFLMARGEGLYVELAYDSKRVCEEFRQAFPGRDELPYGFGVPLLPTHQEWVTARLGCPQGTRYCCFDARTGQAMVGRIRGIASYHEGGEGDMGFVGILDVAPPATVPEPEGLFGERIIGVAFEATGRARMGKRPTIRLSEADKAGVEGALRESLGDPTCDVIDAVRNPADGSVLAIAEVDRAAQMAQSGVEWKNLEGREQWRGRSVFYLTDSLHAYRVMSFLPGGLTWERIGFPLDGYPGMGEQTLCRFLPDLNGDGLSEVFVGAREGCVYACLKSRIPDTASKAGELTSLRSFYYGMRE